MLGVTLAIGALVASLVYGAGLTQFVSTPARYGWSWDYQVEADNAAAARTALGHDSDVAAIALGGYGQLGIGGRNVSAVGVQPVEGVPSVPILDGRAPRTANEVALGRTTMRQLHVGLGDDVVANVGDTKRRLTVVGAGVFPRFAPYPGSDPTGLGTGAVLTLNGLAALDKADPEGDVGTGSAFYLVEMKHGVRTTAAALQRKLFPHTPGSAAVFGPQRPNDALSYDRLERTPTALAALLVLLGAGTAVHLLVTSVRRRRRELAVLKTVGYTRRQVTGTVMTQASILAGLALIVGMPLGVVAGRWLWFVTASWLGIAEQVALPLVALTAVAAACLLGTNLVALVPGRSAARLRPAEVLRSE
jgi:predicted lysophospholipase L1 biosynthesis ABC-type transport system permease subunit